jgi:hypothetical protein
MVILHCRVNLSVAHVSNSIYKPLATKKQDSIKRRFVFLSEPARYSMVQRTDILAPLYPCLPFTSLYRFYQDGRDEMKIGVKLFSGGFQKYSEGS